jgi:hypothetical protein
MVADTTPDLRRSAMSRLCRLSLAIAVVFVVAAPAAPAAPSAPVRVSGAFTVDPPTNVTVQPLPGGRCLIRLTTTFRFTEGSPGGGLVGPFTAPFEIRHSGACDQAAQETFVASGTFTGSVAARSGSFDFVFRGTIDAANNARGVLTVRSASGDLAGLRGAIQLSGIGGVGGTYSGVLIV